MTLQGTDPNNVSFRGKNVKYRIDTMDVTQDHLSSEMIKPVFCTEENKGSESLFKRSIVDQRICLITMESAILFSFLTLKFQVPSHLQRLISNSDVKRWQHVSS